MQNKSKVDNAINQILDEDMNAFEACKILYHLKKEMGKEEFKIHIKANENLNALVTKVGASLLWFPKPTEEDDPELSKYYYWREEQLKNDLANNK